MTKQKSTKRALLMSALALLMCVSMLIGSTFAWFTDSVTSGSNKIVAGNLDVVLEYKTDWNNEWAPVDVNTKIFKEGALYEPGYTEVVYLRVSNAGSLALKYNLMVNIASEKPSTNVNGDEFNLSDYLQIGTYLQDEYANGANYANTLMPIMFGTREAALSNVTLTKLSDADSIVASNRPVLAGEQTAQVMALVLTMPETVGNEANYDVAYEAPEINLGISLVATQHTDESDSFDNQYDKDATYPGITIPEDAIEVSDFEGLESALQNGGNYEITAPFTVEGVLNVAADTAFYNTNESNVVTFAQNARLKTAENADLALYGVKINGGGGYTLDNSGFTYDNTKTINTDSMLMASAGSTLTLGEGTVIENVVSQYPAVAWAKGTVDNRATIIFDGATVRNCAGGTGSIINVDCYGDVYIEDGTVIENNVSHSGNHGIIRIYNNNWDAANASTLTINGGEIKNNYFSGNGMIGLYYAKMNMNGGKITNNAFTKLNSGFYCMIYVHSNSQFIMNDGEISNNTITDGAINAINSEVEGAITFNGGTVTNNSNARNENKDALAAVCYPGAVAFSDGTGKVLVISDEANVTGTVYSHANLNDQVDKKYVELSEFLSE